MQNSYLNKNLESQISCYLKAQLHHSFIISCRDHVYLPKTVMELHSYKLYVEAYSGLRKLLDQHQLTISNRFFDAESGLYNKLDVSKNYFAFESKKILYDFISELTEFIKNHNHIVTELKNIFQNYILRESYLLLDEINQYVEHSNYFEKYNFINFDRPQVKISLV